MADTLFWQLSAERVTDDNSMAGPAVLSNSAAAGAHAAGFNNTTVDAYRHGKYPPGQDDKQFKVVGGMVGFNILYADGHVSRWVDRKEAFRAVRLRFPN